MKDYIIDARNQEVLGLRAKLQTAVVQNDSQEIQKLLQQNSGSVLARKVLLQAILHAKPNLWNERDDSDTLFKYAVEKENVEALTMFMHHLRNEGFSEKPPLAGYADASITLSYEGGALGPQRKYYEHMPTSMWLKVDAATQSLSRVDKIFTDFQSGSSTIPTESIINKLNSFNFKGFDLTHFKAKYIDSLDKYPDKEKALLVYSILDKFIKSGVGSKKEVSAAQAMCSQLNNNLKAGKQIYLEESSALGKLLTQGNKKLIAKMMENSSEINRGTKFKAQISEFIKGHVSLKLQVKLMEVLLEMETRGNERAHNQGHLNFVTTMHDIWNRIVNFFANLVGRGVSNNMLQNAANEVSKALTQLSKQSVAERESLVDVIQAAYTPKEPEEARSNPVKNKEPIVNPTATEQSNTDKLPAKENNINAQKQQKLTSSPIKENDKNMVKQSTDTPRINDVNMLNPGTLERTGENTLANPIKKDNSHELTAKENNINAQKQQNSVHTPTKKDNLLKQETLTPILANDKSKPDLSKLEEMTERGRQTHKAQSLEKNSGQGLVAGLVKKHEQFIKEATKDGDPSPTTRTR